MDRDTTDRFNKYVGPANAVTGCTPWMGARDAKGYGRFRLDEERRGYAAHRVSLMLHTGDEGTGLHAMHRCDNPPCVNPLHLAWGTNAENAHDRWAAGRYRQKLSDEQITEILDLLAGGMTQRAAADRFGVSQSYVWLLKTGKRRK